MSKWIPFALCLSCGTVASSAQIFQPARFELELNENESSQISATTLGENGLAICRQTSGREKDQLEVIRLDTALREIWKVYIEVSKSQNLLRANYHHGSLFLLFKDRLYLGGDFQLVHLDIARGEYVIYLVKNLIPFNPIELIVTRKAALIGGYYNYRPIVLHFSFSQMRSMVLPGFFNSPGELNQLKSDEEDNIEIIVSARNYEKRNSLWIRKYDAEGELLKTTIVRPEENKNLLFGRSIDLPQGAQMVAGVYGRFTDYSRGIFLARINPVGEYSIRYYNFSELHNFFSYMKSGRQRRIKERIDRRTIEGKKIKFNYRFLIHDLIPTTEGQFIMTGEAFYPHYHYSNSTYSNLRNNPAIPGMPGTNSNLVFDFYQYTHAVVVGFDENGKMLWDNSFEINDAKSRQLGQFVKVRREPNRMVMIYLFENTLHTKIIQGSEILEKRTLVPVKTFKEGEIADSRSAESENLDHWYGFYFFACGVINVRGDSGPSRNVFYINKIAYK